MACMEKRLCFKHERRPLCLSVRAKHGCWCSEHCRLKAELRTKGRVVTGFGVPRLRGRRSEGQRRSTGLVKQGFAVPLSRLSHPTVNNLQAVIIRLKLLVPERRVD